jgi:hypothetical protein
LIMIVFKELHPKNIPGGIEVIGNWISIISRTFQFKKI